MAFLKGFFMFYHCIFIFEAILGVGLMTYPLDMIYLSFLGAFSLILAKVLSWPNIKMEALSSFGSLNIGEISLLLTCLFYLICYGH